MNKHQISIVQTVNYLESFEHAKKVCQLIQETKIDGIRINLCKYKRDDIRNVIQNFISVFVDNNIRKVYLDVPYPIDKARVYGLVDGCKNIGKNNEYYIRKGCNVDKISSYGENEIYVNCSRIDVRQEVIFYGDGEGAFKVLEITDNLIRCVALNDFYIINGKSISCGFYVQNECVIREILDSIHDMKVSLLIPFVESAQQLIDIRKLASEDISLIAKIETDKGIRNVESIASESDGILIGRGDMALYSEIGRLIKDLKSITERVSKKIIFCTGILQNFNDIYMPSRAELFDLLLIKEFNADEIVLSGTADFNSNNIHNLYSHSLQSINRKAEFIKNVW